jgi:hypothetical protein
VYELPSSAPRRIKRLGLINTKISTIGHVIEVTRFAKSDQDRSSGRVPLVWVKSATVNFRFKIGPFGTRTAEAGHSTPTHYISVDAVWPKDVSFGGFRHHDTSRGE